MLDNAGWNHDNARTNKTYVFIGFSDMSKESYFGIKIYLQWVLGPRSCQYRPSWGRVCRDMIWLQGHTFAWLGPTWPHLGHPWPYWGLHGHIVASMAVLGPTRSYWGLQGLNGAWIGAGAQGHTSTDSTGDCRALLALGNKENLANWTWKKSMMEKIW